MLDNSLNDMAIKILMFAPILYCAFGFWMFNNGQIFRNDEIQYATKYGEPMKTDHDIWKTMRHARKNVNCYLFFYGFVIMVILSLA